MFINLQGSHPSAIGPLNMCLGSQTGFSFICSSPGRVPIVLTLLTRIALSPITPFWPLHRMEEIYLIVNKSLSKQCYEGAKYFYLKVWFQAMETFQNWCLDY